MLFSRLRHKVCQSPTSRFYVYIRLDLLSFSTPFGGRREQEVKAVGIAAGSHTKKVELIGKVLQGTQSELLT